MEQIITFLFPLPKILLLYYIFSYIHFIDLLKLNVFAQNKRLGLCCLLPVGDWLGLILFPDLDFNFLGVEGLCVTGAG